MMVYKIHPLRVLIACVILLALLSVLIFLARSPPNCIQVSVSIQQHLPIRILTQDIPPPLLNNPLSSLSTLKKPQLYFHVRFRDTSSSSNGMKSHHLPIKATDTASFSNKLRPYVYSPPVQTSSHTSFNNKPMKLHTDAYFRTRIVQNNVENDEDDEDFDDDYEDNDLADNKVFEVGDFDYNGTHNLVDRMFPFSQKISANTSDFLSHSSKRQRNISLINREGVPVVEESIYWSEELENIVPKGVDDAATRLYIGKLRTSQVQRVEPPTWNRCGRPKNQFVVFEDGSKACARYRAPHHYLVQGEVLSFHLSRLLGMRHVPVVVLSSLREDKWSSVREQLLSSAQWEDNATLALIQWVDNLERDRLPPVLLSSLLEKRALSSGELFNMSSDSLVELMQWTDLILFDYVTGNYDRVASMQDAADKEGNPTILAETVHNVVRSRDDGALWMLDNESGLLDAYALLYGGNNKFRSFHARMLHSVCVWRRRTVENLRKMVREGAGQTLMRCVREEERILFGPPPIDQVWTRLQERIEEVEAHIGQCKEAARL